VDASSSTNCSTNQSRRNPAAILPAPTELDSLVGQKFYAHTLAFWAPNYLIVRFLMKRTKVDANENL